MIISLKSIKFFNKNKKGQSPKISQRAYINYALYHKKDTSRLKIITSFSEKNFLIGSEEILKGLEESILLMKVGDSALFKIPPHLAYGDKKTGNILPSSDLYFFVSLKQLEDEFFNHLEKDMNNNRGNGWSCDTIPIPKELNNLEIRKATYEEEREYKRYDKPFKIEEPEQLNEDYTYLIPLLKQLEI